MGKRIMEDINNGLIEISIVGCGGLGSNVAMNLIRAGVVSMKLIDFDTVSESNLNRQFYFRDQIGQLKVNALKENLERINPNAEIKCINTQVLSDNIDTILSPAEIIFECIDNQYIKEIITRYALLNNKIVIAASGICGTNIEYPTKVRKISERFYLVGDYITDIRSGDVPLSSKVSIVAAQQADILLEILRQEYI